MGEEEEAEEKKQDGEENVEIFNEEDTGNTEQKAEGLKKEDQPKRPLNGYMRFSMEIRPTIKKEYPDASAKEIVTKAGEAYRALGDDQKREYKDAADAAMAKFKEEYGSESLKNKKKMKQTKNGDPSGVTLADIPAQPADGLPKGWTTRNIPRKTGDRSDMLWFSPGKSFKFRSKAQTKRFLKILENAGEGDEVATMGLFSEGEKDKRPADNNSNGKKQKSMSEKQKMKKGAVDLESDKDFGHMSDNKSKGEKEKKSVDNNSSGKKRKTYSDKKKKKNAAADIKNDKDFGHVSHNDSKSERDKNSSGKKRKITSEKKKKKNAAADIKSDKDFGHESNNDVNGEKQKTSANNNISGKKRKTMSSKKKTKKAAIVG